MESGEVKMMLYLGTGVMVFFVLGLVLLVISYQRHFFKMKQQEAEAMLKATLETEKRERERIAADLHDSVQGDLSAIRIYLNVLSRRITAEEDREVVKEIRDGVEAALENTRTISHNLMPPLLEAEGLVASVKAYVTGVCQRAGMEVIAEGAISGRLQPSQEYQVFRAVQELAANCIKYSGASSVSFRFREEENKVEIVMEDNGTPFDFYASREASKGAGLRNITSRLEAAGAVLKQENSPGRNRIIISIKRKE
jgi:signal transduction histidine kinase